VQSAIALLEKSQIGDLRKMYDAVVLGTKHFEIKIPRNRKAKDNFIYLFQLQSSYFVLKRQCSYLPNLMIDTHFLEHYIFRRNETKSFLRGLGTEHNNRNHMNGLSVRHQPCLHRRETKLCE